uniref:NADH-ubiquinone oxidoreductase chain 6 n=1 Tax=Brycon orbignyanus TaxID=126315 RepID=A0A088QMY4_9TELE|nr:NADH dehydrogenase subunit 6 [Brycon orbignyanus]AIN79137.1 NADH dehydrogenase subunit 6 [Brycon orbignyanus]ARS00872.1 NADH dehydrogenase subunit 6 [Brycon orbignyanus]
MEYMSNLCLLGMVVGMVGVASNPAPYFGALGLVVVAGTGCGVLISYGGSFLSLVLFLIYLGGMLVVFAYSAALAAEPYPESWGDRSVVGYVLVYSLVVVTVGWWLHWGWCSEVRTMGDKNLVCRGDTVGVAWMYSSGGGMLFVSGLVLLLTLFVVLELTRGLNRGAIREV